MTLHLEGQIFGRLKAVSESRHKNKKAWLCVCECGKEKIVLTESLRCGRTTSCGCLRIENVKKLSKGEALKKRSKLSAEYWKSDEGVLSIKKGAEKRKAMMKSGEMRVASRDREYYVGINKKISKEGRERTKRALLKLAKDRTGKPMTTEKTMKGPANHHAKYWKIKNINTGVVLEGMNLSQIIRDNLDMFDEIDTKGIVEGGRCRASGGISYIRRAYLKTGVSNSWKGWIYFSEII
jgi:hypothetical protein